MKKSTSAIYILFVLNLQLAHSSPVTNLQTSCLLNDNVDSYNNINGIADAVAAGWSHSTDIGQDFWRVLPGAGVSLSNAFSVIEETPASLAGITDSYLISPEITLNGNYYLEFLHKYEFESDASFYDGAQLQITTNNGASWIDLNTYILTGAYNEIISSSYASPIRGEEAWGGEQSTYTLVQVDLSSFNSQSIKIRWRFVSGIDSIAQLGWRIDNIKITDSIGLGDEVFKNGFEEFNLDNC